MRSLLTKKNIVIAASLASAVVSAVILRNKFKKIDDVEVDNLTVDDLSEEPVVVSKPVRNKKEN